MDTESIKMIAEIAGSLTTQAVLLYWVFVERRRFEAIFAAVLEDWKRQREREIDASVEKSRNGSFI
jgi:hypothetical protein